jgi:hypothetical protein
MKTRLTQRIVFDEKEMGLKPTKGLVKQLTILFFDTVHSVNKCDYTDER